MTAISASTPGKAILFGEHAVVYGYPAIAIPVSNVRTKTYISANPRGKSDQIFIEAPDIDLKNSIDDLPENNPVKALLLLLKKHLNIHHFPSFNLKIKSTIPIAAGLGSGAAVSISIIRALCGFLGIEINNEDISEIAFQIEKLHHGTPSGIDNTVITYKKPIYFVKDKPFKIVNIKNPFTLLIADSGVRSLTSEVVGGLREKYRKMPQNIDQEFNKTGEIVDKAYTCLTHGDYEDLGILMNQNQEILSTLGVSHKVLDHLIDVAVSHGAFGAKLSGAGQGGNIIALVENNKAPSIAEKLITAGAVKTIITEVKSWS